MEQYAKGDVPKEKKEEEIREFYLYIEEEKFPSEQDVSIEFSDPQCPACL